MNISWLFLCILLIGINFSGTESIPSESTKETPLTSECLSGTYPPDKKTIVPSYVVNLDDPPEKRWHKIAKDKASNIANIMSVLRSFLHEFGSIGDTVFSFVNDDVGEIVKTLPNPYRDEIIGISKSSNISLGEIVTYNIFYEIFTVCTSIIAKDDKGNLYHGRNLDFGLFMGWDVKKHSWKITEALRPVVINVDFQKGGKTVFKSAQMAGYIGILTAIKPGIFTLTMDERFDLLDGGYIGVIEWLLGERKAQWMGFLTRNVMEKANSYDKAKSMLSETTMLAPAYFILGGNSSNQACVITRSRNKAINVWEMKDSWYILQTNYDHWKNPPFYDDRRTPGKMCMDEKGSNSFSRKVLFDVLSSKPVKNKLTSYTALMQVKTGMLETYLQTCPDPCFPW